MFAPKEPTWIFAASAFLGTFFWNWLNSLNFRVSSLLEILLHKEGPYFFVLYIFWVSFVHVYWCDSALKVHYYTEDLNCTVCTYHHRFCSVKSPQGCLGLGTYTLHQEGVLTNELIHTPMTAPHPNDLRHTPVSYVSVLMNYVTPQ